MGAEEQPNPQIVGQADKKCPTRWRSTYLPQNQPDAVQGQPGFYHQLPMTSFLFLPETPWQPKVQKTYNPLNHPDQLPPQYQNWRICRPFYWDSYHLPPPHL